MSWERHEAYCDANTISAGRVFRVFGNGYTTMTCDSGCSESVRVWFQCTDFNVDENWSAGHGSSEMTLSGLQSFEAS